MARLRWFAVKLTVKERIDGNYRLYDHQVLEMAKPGGIYGTRSGNATEVNAEKLVGRPAPGLPVSIGHGLRRWQTDKPARRREAQAPGRIEE